MGFIVNGRGTFALACVCVYPIICLYISRHLTGISVETRLLFMASVAGLYASFSPAVSEFDPQAALLVCTIQYDYGKDATSAARAPPSQSRAIKEDIARE